MRRSWLARAGLVGWLLAGSVLGGGCGDSTSSTPSYVGEEQTALVSAKEGGELAAGAVKVKVPAGAVDKDTEFSVRVKSKEDQPGKDSIAVDVYEIGPSTQFKKPV